MPLECMTHSMAPGREGTASFAIRRPLGSLYQFAPLLFQQ